MWPPFHVGQAQMIELGPIFSPNDLKHFPSGNRYAKENQKTISYYSSIAVPRTHQPRAFVNGRQRPTTDRIESRY